MLYTETPSGSTVHQIRDFGPADIVESQYFIGGHEMSTPSVMINLRPQNLTLAEREFEEQERLFEQIPPLLLEPYRGQFVASMDGQIVDSDEDLATLSRRFFETHGDMAVFMTKVGEEFDVVIDTPFLD